MLKKLSLFGIVSPLAFFTHIVLGGMLWKDYNHVIQPISDLTAAGAPNRGLLNMFTNVSRICDFIFVVSAFIYLRKLKSRAIDASMFLLVLMSLSRFLYLLFPEDMPGTALTFKGFMHVALTVLIMSVAVLGPFLAGIGFATLDGFRKFSIYSIATSLVIFITAILSTIVKTNNIPMLGAVERVNIFSLYLWDLILALMLFTANLDGALKRNVKQRLL